MSKFDKLMDWFVVALMVVMWLAILFSILYTLFSLPFMVHIGDWFGIVRNVIVDVIVLAIGVVATWHQVTFVNEMKEMEE